MTGSEIRTLQIGNDWFAERQGGLNRVYSELLKHLPAVGVGVRGLVAGSSQVEVATHGVVTGFASPSASLVKRALAARRAGLRILREGKTDLIAAHFALYAFPLLHQLGKLPTVIHFHGPWAAEAGVEGQSSWSSKAQAAIEHAVYVKGRRLIVLSRAFGRELETRYRIPPDRIRIVPGGIDTERFNVRLTRHQAREQLGWPPDRPIVLSVRRQMRRMGLENLVDAAALVSRKAPDVLILLAGSGPLSAELAQRIRDRGLDENVKQLGRVDDAALPIAYRAADLSIVPSQALEGFGMITLESLASGTPVLVTPVGGLPEVVQPFAPQCVLEDTSTEVIAGVLTDFLLGRQPLPSSDACRDYAAKNFSWPTIAALTRKIYEEAIH